MGWLFPEVAACLRRAVETPEGHCIWMEISNQPSQQSNCSSKSPEQLGRHDTGDLNLLISGSMERDPSAARYHN